MILSENLFNEHLEKLNNYIITTDSKFEVRDTLLKNKFEQKLIFCPDTKYWLIGDALNIVHNDLLDYANDSYLTKLKNYFDLGILYFKPYTTSDVDDTISMIQSDYTEPDVIKIYQNFIIGYNKQANIDCINDFDNLFKKHKALTNFIEV